MDVRNLTLLIAFGLAPLAACSTNTKGAWSCPADKGIACQSIDGLDHVRGRPRPDGETPPRVGGAGAVRWWAANDALAGNFDRAPRREPDQVVRIMIAGWTDGAGDFHAPSEVYAVMRHGGWWAPPPALPLAPTKTADKPGAPPKVEAPPPTVVNATPAERPSSAAIPPAPSSPKS
jgi:conjugal transfer pilus assembly protein TraV